MLVAGVLPVVHAHFEKSNFATCVRHSRKSNQFKRQAVDTKQALFNCADKEHGHNGTHTNCDDCHTCHLSFALAMETDAFTLQFESLNPRHKYQPAFIKSPFIDGLIRPPRA